MTANGAISGGPFPRTRLWPSLTWGSSSSGAGRGTDDATPTKTPHYARHVYPFREDRGFQVNEIVAVLICEIADREFDRRHEERMVSIREIGSYPKLTRRFKNEVIAWYVQNKEKQCPSG